MDSKNDKSPKSPKVLMVGNYFDDTGWSRACIEYAMALDSVGVDVTCRAIKLNNRKGEVPERLLQLLEKPVLQDHCPDVVIQHVLPQMAQYYGPAKNILLFASEDEPISPDWIRYCNAADEVWAISEWQGRAIHHSGVTRPIYHFPHCVDTRRYNGPFRTLDVFREMKKNGVFLFYTIGELVGRKNLEGLIRAFLSEFSMHERVALVVKGDLPGRSPEESTDYLKNLAKSIRASLKLGNYPDVTLISQRLSDENILNLHHSCDCFVTASHAEAFCWPSFDAMMMGRTPIVPASTGFLSYADHGSAYLVHTQKDISHGCLDTQQGNHTGRQTWSAVNLVHLRRRMREVFERPPYHENIRAYGKERLYDFSREKVGQKLRARITALLGAKNGEEESLGTSINHPLGEFAR